MSDKNNKQELPKDWGSLGRAILNGMIGDYLDKENNPLAIQMGFYHHSRRLALNEYFGQQLSTTLTNKVVVFVHGLTNLETVWDYPVTKKQSNDVVIGDYINNVLQEGTKSERDSYGSKLQADFGYTPLYLRYNTGLSIERNGRYFASILKRLQQVYPIQIDQLMLVGFSMGGLIIRQAQHFAQNNDFDWVKVVNKCVYLGTPHEGSHLEKIGHLGGELVRQVPFESVNHWADWIDARSQGIQDLRHGMKFQKDEHAQFEQALFLESARHYFVSGSVGADEVSLLSKVFGDSMVRQTSAVPSSAPSNSQIARLEKISHMPLAHSDRVYEQLATWVSQDEYHQSGSGHTPLSPLVRFKPEPLPYVEPEYFLDATSRALLAGTLDLIASLYDKVLQSVETMHYSIAQEPFFMLQKVPVASQLAKPIEGVHRDILNLVYRLLRKGGRLLHSTASLIAPKEEPFLDRPASDTHTSDTLLGNKAFQLPQKGNEAPENIGERKVQRIGQKSNRIAQVA